MVNVNDDPTNRFKGVVTDLEKLNQLHKVALGQLAPYFLSRIKILHQSTSKRHRISKPIEGLRVGDIIIEIQLKCISAVPDCQTSAR